MERVNSHKWGSIKFKTFCKNTSNFIVRPTSFKASLIFLYFFFFDFSHPSEALIGGEIRIIVSSEEKFFSVSKSNSHKWESIKLKRFKKKLRQFLLHDQFHLGASIIFEAYCLKIAQLNRVLFSPYIQSHRNVCSVSRFLQFHIPV